MEFAKQEIIHEAANGSNEGRLHFGQVIGLMLEAGVESYVADYRARRSTYYLPDGDTLSMDVQMPDVEIPQAFDVEAVKAAIRGAQQGAVVYPEFKRLTRQAGCIGYAVWISGRHVTYFGRKGEMHIEPFPN